MSFLIIDIAGKHYSTNDSIYANNLVINEIEIFDKKDQRMYYNTLNISQTGGNLAPFGISYWSLSDTWSPINLKNAQLSYSEVASTALIDDCDDSCDIDKFVRFVLSVEDVNQIGKINAWFGGGNGIYRLPKQMSIYFCNGYSVINNIQKRSNNGLVLVDTKIIPNNLTTATAFTFNQIPYLEKEKFYTYLI